MYRPKEISVPESFNKFLFLSEASHTKFFFSRNVKDDSFTEL